MWAPGDVLEFQHLHHDFCSLGFVYDNVGGDAFDVVLFWIEDVGLRARLTMFHSPRLHGLLPED